MKCYFLLAILLSVFILIQPLHVSHQQGARLLFSSDQQQYYVIWQGKKRSVPSSLLTSVFDKSKYTQRTQQQVQSFTCGPALDPNAFLVQVTGKAEVYFMNYGNRYHINSPDVMTDFGFDWGKIKQVGSEDQIGCFIDYGDMVK